MVNINQRAKDLLFEYNTIAEFSRSVSLSYSTLWRLVNNRTSGSKRTREIINRTFRYYKNKWVYQGKIKMSIMLKDGTILKNIWGSTDVVRIDDINREIQDFITEIKSRYGEQAEIHKIQAERFSAI